MHKQNNKLQSVGAKKSSNTFLNVSMLYLLLKVMQAVIFKL